MLRKIALISVLLVCSFTVQATPSPNGLKFKSWRTTNPATQEEDQLRAQFPELKSNCGAHPEVKAGRLQSAKGSSRPELITSCLEQCSIAGCPYQVYSFQNNRYQLIADFKGRYEVLTTQSHGFYSIKIKSATGAEVAETVLQYSGSQYQPSAVR